MIFSYYKVECCPKNVIVFQGSDIAESMIDECFKIDEGFFDKKFIYDSNKIKKIIKKYNKMCFIFFDLEKNKVIGYNFIIPIKPKSKDLYLEGKISYFTFGETDIVSPLSNEQASLLYLSTAYSKEVDFLSLLKLVQNCMSIILAQYKRKYGFTVTSYFLDSVCEFDATYANALRLNKTKDTAYGSEIYYAEFNPATFYKKAQYCTNLINAYNGQ